MDRPLFELMLHERTLSKGRLSQGTELIKA